MPTPDLFQQGFALARKHVDSAEQALASERFDSFQTSLDEARTVLEYISQMHPSANGAAWLPEAAEEWLTDKLREAGL